MIDIETVADWSSFIAFASMQSSSDGEHVEVQVFDAIAGTFTEAVYVWLGKGDAIIRIGTSKQPVAKRMAQYPKHINAALAGERSPTPRSEAESWLNLVKIAPITALVYQPPFLDTVWGPIRPYLDIERTLLSTFKTRLNRSHR